jgi:uncharacterized protein
MAGEVAPESLDLHDPDIRVMSPVKCEFVAVLAGDELLVDGRLRVTVQFRCGRCGEMFEKDVEEPAFHYDCQTEKGIEFVDLTGEIRESILLSFPVYPVCRPDCLGLCPQCGANRNRKPCRCKPPTDARWRALDGLVG